VSGHKKWSTLRDQLQADPVRNERYQSIRRATFDAVRLGEVREAREKTQVQVAETVGTTHVSRLEIGGDLYGRQEPGLGSSKRGLSTGQPVVPETNIG